MALICVAPWLRLVSVDEKLIARANLSFLIRGYSSAGRASRSQKIFWSFVTVEPRSGHHATIQDATNKPLSIKSARRVDIPGQE